MKNSKYLKRGVTAVLASAIIMSSMPSYAATQRFKDVPTTHWSYPYIEQMASIGYINGVGNDMFNPSGSLNFDAAITLLTKLVDITETEKNNAKLAYSKLLTDLKINSWVHEGLSIALYKNIITEAELKTINNNNQIGKPLNRIKTAEYFIKVLGLEEEVKSSQPVSLKFTDVLSMSATQTKYVSVLIDIGVLSADGRGDGTFGPNTSLTREQMAKMMAVAYEYKQEKSKPEEIEVEAVEGVISEITKVGTAGAIKVTDSKNKAVVYSITNDSKITLDGKVADISKLVVGQDVELILKKGTNQTVEVNAYSFEQIIEGKIKAFSTSKLSITVEYKENNKTVSKEFTIPKDVEIYLNDKEVEIKNLKNLDEIEIVLLNNVVTEVYSESRLKEVDGILKSITPVKDSKTEEYEIVIVDSKNKSHKFIVDKYTDIYRNDRAVEVDKLKVDDEVYVEAEYNIVDIMDAYPVVAEIEGFVVEMKTRLQEATRIVVLNQKTKEEEEYILTGNTYIRVDGSVATSYDLKTGYFVELVTEGDEVTEIYAETAGITATIVGNVTSVATKSKTLEIQVTDFTSDSSKYGQKMTIYTNNVTIMDKKGNILTFDYIYKGDIVNVIGIYDGSTFIADTILILN